MTILKVPQGKTGELHLNGRSFPIDKNGLVEVPDDCITSKVWQDGYTVYQPDAVKEAPAKVEKTASDAGKGSN